MKKNSFIIVLFLVSMAMASFGRTYVFQEGEIVRGAMANAAFDEVNSATVSTALAATQATITAILADDVLTKASLTTTIADVASKSYSSMTQNLVTNAYWISGDGGNEGISVTSTGRVLIATNTALGSTTAYMLQVNGSIYATNPGNIYVAGVVSAENFIDRTDCPESLEDAKAIVDSHESVGGKLDHSKLSSLAWGKKSVPRTIKTSKEIVIRQKNSPITHQMTGQEFTETRKVVDVDEVVMDVVPDQSGRNISMVISAQAMVIKDLEARLKKLESKPEIVNTITPAE